MFHCCSYNVNTHMADVLVHVELMYSSYHQTQNVVHPNTVYDDVAIVRMFRMLSLTGAMNKDHLW